MIEPDTFLDIVSSRQGTKEIFKLAVVDPDHGIGRPRLIFDGEEIVSVKTYPHLESYAPVANDRVLLGRVGHTWVILGGVI